MPEKDSVKNVIQTLEAIRGAELDPEDYSEIDEWNKGRALTQMVVLPGWQVILEMLASYAANSASRLHSIDPKNKDEVLAEHAVTFAATRIYHNFVNDTASAIEKARKTPNIIKDGLRKISPAPPESML